MNVLYLHTSRIRLKLRILKHYQRVFRLKDQSSGKSNNFLILKTFLFFFLPFPENTTVYPALELVVKIIP